MGRPRCTRDGCLSPAMLWGLALGVALWSCGSGSDTTNGNQVARDCTNCASNETCYQNHCVDLCTKIDAYGNGMPVVCGPSPYDQEHSCGTCREGSYCAEFGTQCLPKGSTQCGDRQCDGACATRAFLCSGDTVGQERDVRLPICCPYDFPAAVVYSDGILSCCPTQYPYPCLVGEGHECCAEPGHCRGGGCSNRARNCNGLTVDLDGAICCPAGEAAGLWPDGTWGCCETTHPYPCVVNGVERCCTVSSRCNE